MAAPMLVPLASSGALLAGHRPPVHAQELFLVVAEGEFAGRSFAAGDLLACGGRAHSGDLVVLVPRGHGRPRLGTIRGARLLGDAGEPCHEIRWRVAGRLVAVVHEPRAARELRPRVPSELRRAAAPQPQGPSQLPLFGAAA